MGETMAVEAEFARIAGPGGVISPADIAPLLHKLNLPVPHRSEIKLLCGRVNPHTRPTPGVFSVDPARRNFRDPERPWTGHPASRRSTAAARACDGWFGCDLVTLAQFQEIVHHSSTLASCGGTDAAKVSPYTPLGGHPGHPGFKGHEQRVEQFRSGVLDQMFATRWEYVPYQIDGPTATKAVHFHC